MVTLIESFRALSKGLSVATSGRSAYAPPVVCDDAITMLPKEQHLPVPVVRDLWSAMRKHDRLPLSPVLIVNLRAVFGRDGAHSLKNGAVTQSYRIQHHIPARPCLRLAETLQGTSEAFVLPKTPARR